MEIKLLEQVKMDFKYWKKTDGKAIIKKTTALLKDISEHPYRRIGKLEPLKNELAGKMVKTYQFGA